jgi:signal transduction histidine kinase
LSTILCITALLGREIAENESAAKLADEIRVAAERAAGISRRVLSVMRRAPSPCAPANVSACVSEARELLELVAGDRVQLSLTLQADVGDVRVDRAELDHVLLHLVTRARDAMPQGGTLTIATYQVPGGVSPAHYVALAVSDTGEGMPADVRERVFERFGASERSGHAAGAGLASAHAFAKRAGGCISLHSAPGQGTRIVVYLPVVGASRGAAEEP